MINVNEILGKHLKIRPAESLNNSIRTHQPIDVSIVIKAAIKEIVEEVVKEAANSGKLTEFAYEFLQEGASEAIDKQSILDVAKQVKYE